MRKCLIIVSTTGLSVALSNQTGLEASNITIRMIFDSLYSFATNGSLELSAVDAIICLKWSWSLWRQRQGGRYVNKRGRLGIGKEIEDREDNSN